MNLEIQNNVSVSVDSIVICADDSITKIPLPHGYTIRKVAFDEYRNANRIIDGTGKLNFDYYCSRVLEKTAAGQKEFFYVLEKAETIKLPNIILKPKVPYPIGNNSECLNAYQQKEKKVLLDLVYLLQVYKRGNIWLKEIFFNFHNTTLIYQNASVTEKIIDVNPYSTSVYHLDDDEVRGWDRFYKDNVSSGLVLMIDIVGLFSLALKQVEPAVKFVLLTTALEMMFLAKNDEKKEPLSKRVAVFSQTNDSGVYCRYLQMLSFYQLRSASIHEGQFNAITSTEANSLEEITRDCIKAYFVVCNSVCAKDKTITWNKIKDKTIQELKRRIGSMNKPGGIFSRIK